MNFFKNFRDFTRQISKVERKLENNRDDFLEVYEKNLILEKEIADRVQELSVTNKRMLSLQHILDMMNSSQPLSNVFHSIVSMLQEELNYLNCSIIKIEEDENNEKHAEMISQSEDLITKKMNDALSESGETLDLICPDSGIFYDSMIDMQMRQSSDLRGTLRSIAPHLQENTLRKILSNAQSRIMIVIPLKTQEKPFGWLVIFSPKNTIDEKENDFLKLFSQQIDLAITIADLFQVVKNQAVTDALTGLYNRRYFNEFFDNEVIRSKRMGQHFTVIGLDLDHLKRINDTYGHSFGDLAIKTVADVLKKNARSIDVAARMGGEEFNILLPGVDSSGGMIAAERIRSALESEKLDTIGHVTASIGVATFFEHTDNPEELIELVDQAMYSAKQNGRNQVKLAKYSEDVSWQGIAIDTFVEILSKHKVPVSKALSDELCQKLKATEGREKSFSKETLYAVSDMLTQTYNPSHQNGMTKSKVELAVKLAKYFDLSEEDIDRLKIAEILYDIGNLMLPQELFLKSEPLTDEEKKKIHEHPLIAARDILEPISYVQDIIPIIEAHHENWDGTGYPKKAQKKDIPLSSQIILLLDSYFALTEPRSYRKALKKEDAIELIKSEAGKKWNEELVTAFTKLIKTD